MKKQKLPQLLAVIFLLGFLFFTYFVSFNLFNGVDLQTTKFSQKIIPRFLDVPFSLLSLLGSLEIVSVILLILFAVKKQLNYFYVLIFFAFFHIAEIIGKLFVNHPNPPMRFFRYSIPFSFPTSEVNTGSSFPSGHMGRTIFISIIFAFIIYTSKKLTKQQKNYLYYLIIIIASLMLVSRIYLGEHWLSDVIGGGILGAAFGILSLGFL